MLRHQKEQYRKAESIEKENAELIKQVHDSQMKMRNLEDECEDLTL